MNALPMLLLATEVAEALRVDTSTVYRWARDKEIRSVRLPGGSLRFPRADVERMASGEPANS